MNAPARGLSAQMKDTIGSFVTGGRLRVAESGGNSNKCVGGSVRRMFDKRYSIVLRESECRD